MKTNRIRKSLEEKQEILAELRRGSLDHSLIIARWGLTGMAGLRQIASSGGLSIKGGKVVPRIPGKVGRPKNEPGVFLDKPKEGTLSRMVYDKLASGVQRDDPRFLQYCKQNVLSSALVSFVLKRFFKRTSTPTQATQ